MVSLLWYIFVYCLLIFDFVLGFGYMEGWEIDY